MNSGCYSSSEIVFFSLHSLYEELPVSLGSISKTNLAPSTANFFIFLFRYSES